MGLSRSLAITLEESRWAVASLPTRAARALPNPSRAPFAASLSSTAPLPERAAWKLGRPVVKAAAWLPPPLLRWFGAGAVVSFLGGGSPARRYAAAATGGHGSGVAPAGSGGCVVGHGLVGGRLAQGVGGSDGGWGCLGAEIVVRAVARLVKSIPLGPNQR